MIWPTVPEITNWNRKKFRMELLLTNVGSFGNVMGTPIINQPQVAILAVGAIRKKPAVIETPEGDTIGIRHMMFLSFVPMIIVLLTVHLVAVSWEELPTTLKNLMSTVTSDLFYFFHLFLSAIKIQNDQNSLQKFSRYRFWGTFCPTFSAGQKAKSRTCSHNRWS